MKHQCKSLLIPVFLSLILIACNQDIINPDLNGDMIGHVYAFDEYGNQLDDFSGVQITAIGEERYSARSDENGRFALEGLHAGTYELTIEKEGFGTMKLFGVQHLGGTPTFLGGRNEENLRVFCIFQLPTLQITNISLIADTLFVETSQPDNQPQYAEIFLHFSSSAGFDLNEADYSQYFTLMAIGNVYKGYIYGLPESYEKGQTIYLKGQMRFWEHSPYPNTLYPIDSYYDPSLHETIYPNLGNESLEFTYVVPQ